MLHGSRLVIAFDTGANAGDLVQTTNLDAFDLSRCEAIDVIVSLTTADVASDDLFDIFFEERFGTVTWDQRLHSHQFSGDMTATATAPEERRYRIQSRTVLDNDDMAYEMSGSAGASSLSAAQVKHGPFAPKLHATTAPFALQATHRLRFVTDDNDSDARFSGSVTLVFHSPL